MATAADQTLTYLGDDGLVRAITTTDDAVSVFNVPANTEKVSLLITGNPATILFSQASGIVNGLARPSVNTKGRLDLPVNTTIDITPRRCGVSGLAPWKIGVCTTSNGSNTTVQASLEMAP